jgi:hypothetical protein
MCDLICFPSHFKTAEAIFLLLESENPANGLIFDATRVNTLQHPMKKY